MIGSEERSAKFWDGRAATYEKTEAGNQQLHGAIVERSLKYLRSDDIALDFACGTGALSSRFAPHVKVLHGLDISPQMIDTAKDRSDQRDVAGLQFSAGSIFEDAFQAESFDVILASQALHVLSNRDAAIDRIYELLKPGGWFLSTTPCRPDSRSIMKLANGALSLASSARIIPYMKFYSVPDLECSIARSGFEIQETAGLPFDQREDMRYVFARFIAARKIR